jgi:lipoprotein-releasing system ATP-binding protein
MLIVAQGVSKKFKQGNLKTEVLKQINFVFSSETTYALTGASGSGKSTLMHLLCGLDHPSCGTIKFQNGNFEKNNFGVIFQDDYLIQQLTVLENIELAGLAKNLVASTVETTAINLLEKVGLSDKANTYPMNLSGGQKTRVALCRALVTNPDFLFADEPTGNLDEENAQKIIALILQLREQLNMGVIICTHDRNVFSQMEQVLRVENGQLKAMGRS